MLLKKAIAKLKKRFGGDIPDPSHKTSLIDFIRRYAKTMERVDTVSMGNLTFLPAVSPNSFAFVNRIQETDTHCVLKVYSPEYGIFTEQYYKHGRKIPVYKTNIKWTTLDQDLAKDWGKGLPIIRVAKEVRYFDWGFVTYSAGPRPRPLNVVVYVQ